MSHMYSSQSKRHVNKQLVQQPHLYKVMLLSSGQIMNGNIERLSRVVTMESKATSLIQELQKVGQVSIGTYSFDVAETKVVQVQDYLKQNRIKTLNCTLRKVKE